MRTDAIKKMMSHVRVKYCFYFLAGIVAIGVLAPLLSPYPPEKPFYDSILQPPSLAHWLGTDAIGRDVLSRMIHGVRVTLSVSLMAVLITFTVGLLIGLISAYAGGALDNVLMRIMDVFLALPSIMLALAIVAILGPGMTHAMIAVGISSIPAFARLVRSAALSIKASGFVEASKSIGSSPGWIVRRHYLPNIAGVLLVYTMLFIGIAILETAALSFIGLGAQPPTPEWGTMLSEGKKHIYDAWWLATFPGIVITAVVFVVNFLSDSLQSVFDPKSSA